MAKKSPASKVAVRHVQPKSAPTQSEGNEMKKPAVVAPRSHAAVATRPTESKAKPAPATASKPAVPATTKSTPRRVPPVNKNRLIRAENFAYTLHDLRFIGVLAALMVVIMVVLHFVLPA